MLPIDAQLAWGKTTEQYQGYVGRMLYVTDRRAQMDGSGIANAVRRIGLDPTRPNMASTTVVLPDAVPPATPIASTWSNVVTASFRSWGYLRGHGRMTGQSREQQSWIVAHSGSLSILAQVGAINLHRRFHSP